jgi:hypothetical protein
MINNGPFSLRLDVIETLPNPYATMGGTTPAAVQVCNTTSYTLLVSTGGSPNLIQAFSTVTVPVTITSP